MRISTNEIKKKKWRLNVGEGQYSTKFERNNSLLKIPHNFLSNDDLIIEIFGNEVNPFDISIKNKVILCPTNNNVLQMNNEILSWLNGDSKEYLSIGTIVDDENECLQNCIRIEFLNSIPTNGRPPHKIILKIGAIIILLRNLNLEDGLCNGTKLIVRSLGEYVIKADIITGNNAGITVLVPRIGLILQKKKFHLIWLEGNFLQDWDLQWLLINHRKNHFKMLEFFYRRLY